MRFMFKISLVPILSLASACSNSGSTNADAVWGQPSANAQPASATSVAEDESGDSLLSSVTGRSSSEDAAPSDPAADPPRPATSFNDCTRMFPGGKPPVIVSPAYASAMKPTYRELCYRAFALGHSGRTRTSLWSAEVLTQATLQQAYNVGRVDNFQEDASLPKDHRSTLDDYRKSGYDRGHLAPSADMPSRPSQEESFLLSNIVPQNGVMNGGVWRDLEMNIRREAKKRKVYVVTGPIFHGSTKALKKRVLVPTAMYKAMFAVGKGVTVFVVTNDETAQTTTLSQEQFIAIYGIDPFPGLTGVVRSHNIANDPLPKEIKNKDQENKGKRRSSALNSECSQYARAKGENSRYSEKNFFKVYGRYPTSDEWEKC